MLYTTLLILSGSMMASTAPVLTRRANNDLLVLQFANVLEQLETGFYSQALLQFKDSDFTAAGFSSSQIPLEQLVTIQSDEQAHVTALQAAIQDFGGTPITSCKFNFAPVLQNVPTMINVARILEDVGLGAYLGAAHLISDPVLLTTAGSILTVEARHQTVLNILSGTGTAIPSAFDIALAPQEVLAIVTPFLSGPCDLGIQRTIPLVSYLESLLTSALANPTLVITNQGPVQPGTMLTFQSTAMNSSTNASSMFCQMLMGGATNSLSLPLSQCVVPGGSNGPMAIWITSDSQPIANDVVNRTPNSIVAGPTMMYVDTSGQMLSQMVVNGGNSTGSTSRWTIRLVYEDGQSLSLLHALMTGVSSSSTLPPPVPTNCAERVCYRTAR
ncbi:ferritin-like domain-containing protein [Amanita rubescens]|nr:ferritin-like domain-containing protein [Amanita rubescens]